MQTFIYFFNNIDLYKTLVISVCFMKPKDLIACQMTGFFFPYKQLLSQILWLTVGLTVDS